MACPLLALMRCNRPLTTAVCLAQATRETADWEYQVLVDDGTTQSEDTHRVAWLAFGLVFGRVRMSEDLLSLLTAPSLEAAPA